MRKYKFLLAISILLVLMIGKINAQVFSGGGGAISDDSLPNYYSLNVSSGFSTINFNYGVYGVATTITHPFDADLHIFLIAPDGVTVELSTKNGSSGDNYTNTIFTNYATNSISNASVSKPPFNGTFRPEASLSVVNNGQNANGIWKLMIVDSKKNSDAGYLQGWSLIFSSNPSKPIPFTSSNLPIMLINTNGQAIQDEPKVFGDMRIISNDTSLNFLNDTTKFYKHNIAIESRGSSSQGFPKKPYGFFTVDANGIDSNTSLLGLPEEHSWILNATYNDKSLMRDVMTYELARRTGRYATRYKYCELFINGSYEGIYILMEKIKRDANRVDISKLMPTDTAGDELTGGYIVKIDKTTGNFNGGWTDTFPTYPNSPYKIFFQYDYPELAAMPTQQSNYIKNYIYLFENALAGSQFTHPTLGYRQYADVGSFIDLSIMNEISKNVDGYRLSTYLYKDKVSKGGKLTMGPIWDYNLAWNNADYGNSSATSGWEIDLSATAPFWWKRFRQDTGYVNSFYCRWSQLRNSTLSFHDINNFIDSTQAYLKEAAFRNFQRWPVLGLYVWPNPSPLSFTMEDENTNLKAWINNRFAWIDSQVGANCNTVNTCKPKVGLFADNTVVCKNQPVKLYADGIGTSFQWSPAIGLNTTIGRNVIATADTTRTYRVIMTTQYGCKDTGYITITTLPLPNKNLTGNTSICKGTSTILSATVGATSYKWTPSVSLDTGYGRQVVATPLITTTYKMVAFNASGCSDSSYITVVVNQNVIVKITPSKDTACLNENVTLTASGANTYRWLATNGLNDTSGNIVVVHPNTATTYKVIGTSVLGCLDTAIFTLNYYPKSFLQINTASNQMCIGDTRALTVMGGNSYQWLPNTYFSGSTSSSITVSPNSTTTYRVAGVSKNGCLDTTSIQLIVMPKPKVEITTPDTQLCYGKSAILTASGAVSYQWIPNSGLSVTNGNIAFVNPLVKSTYIVVGTNANGCKDTARITIAIQNKPILKITGNTDLCRGQSNSLLATGAATYTWYPAIGLNKTFGDQVEASPESSTTYHVVGIGNNGCIDTINFRITVHEVPSVSISPTTTTINKGQQTILSASGAKNFTWWPISGLNTTTGNIVIASPTTTTTYIVTGSDSNQCITSSTATIYVTTVGINHKTAENSRITIYPNPVNGNEIVIKDNGYDEDKKACALYDLTGKTLCTFALHGAETTLGISNITSGVYFIKVGQEFLRFEKL